MKRSIKRKRKIILRPSFVDRRIIASVPYLKHYANFASNASSPFVGIHSRTILVGHGNQNEFSNICRNNLKLWDFFTRR